MRLLGYLGWLPRCCYAVAKVKTFKYISYFLKPTYKPNNKVHILKFSVDIN